MTKQLYGDYAPDLNFAGQGIGTVSACSGLTSLLLLLSNTGGSYGTYSVVMKKN
ncbi:MAG: hypothetical protein ABIQ88_12380 [Chitinophagaceae bacterium]